MRRHQAQVEAQKVQNSRLGVHILRRPGEVPVHSRFRYMPNGWSQVKLAEGAKLPVTTPRNRARNHRPFQRSG